jgi:hypothetical protein
VTPASQQAFQSKRTEVARKNGRQKPADHHRQANVSARDFTEPHLERYLLAIVPVSERSERHGSRRL